MQTQFASPRTDNPARETVRLHYLDWLRVLATLGVFLFHASNVFNTTNFEIKNAEGSEAILFIDIFFYPWGMPLFFLIAGAGTWFALRRRSAGQFTRERTLRILVPFFTGTLLLGPIQLYLSWSHRIQTGVFAGSFAEFVGERLSYTGPKLFGAIGYHMWFLGFLFAFSLLALPLFNWFKGETGCRFISRLAGLCEQRGAILLFILPLAAVRLGLQPFFPQLQHWADFFTYGTFFVLGYVLFADERFSRAIRRDWWILLVVGIAATLAGMIVGPSLESFGIENPLRTFEEFLMWGVIAICGWCWATFMLFIGLRFLNRDSAALQYGQRTLLPFFVIHQPVILAIAYFVVQWQAALLIKLLVVVFGSFVVCLALTELVIKRVDILRVIFGMKSERSIRAQVGAVTGR
ncbi:MAG: acyltransferase family protein [Chloroflexi bacterium]|nr:acyltransferase family protein [Chloroflexota bacterium]